MVLKIICLLALVWQLAPPATVGGVTYTHRSFITADETTEDGETLSIHQNDHAEVSKTAVMVSYKSPDVTFSTHATSLKWMGKRNERIELTGTCTYQGKSATWLLDFTAVSKPITKGTTLEQQDRFFIVVRVGKSMVYHKQAVLIPFGKNPNGAILVR